MAGRVQEHLALGLVRRNAAITASTVGGNGHGLFDHEGTARPLGVELCLAISADYSIMENHW